MSEPRWIDKRALLLRHDEGVREHGRPQGLRDEGLLDSALARPQNVFAYEVDADVARLAASYAIGLARNQAFVDVNKRVALLAAGLFPALNGFRLTADRVDATRTIVGVAAGDVDETRMAEWIRARAEKRAS